MENIFEIAHVFWFSIINTIIPVKYFGHNRSNCFDKQNQFGGNHNTYVYLFVRREVCVRGGGEGSKGNSLNSEHRLLITISIFN